MRTKNYSSGYILIISSLIISFSLLTLVVGTSFENFERLLKVFERENKEFSYNLALSCVDQAILRVVQNPNWKLPIEGLEIPIDNYSCFIEDISKDGKEIFIKTHAQVNKSFTFLKAIFDQEKFEITSVREF